MRIPLMSSAVVLSAFDSLLFLEHVLLITVQLSTVAKTVRLWRKMPFFVFSVDVFDLTTHAVHFERSIPSSVDCWTTQFLIVTLREPVPSTMMPSNFDLRTVKPSKMKLEARMRIPSRVHRKPSS